MSMDNDSGPFFHGSGNYLNQVVTQLQAKGYKDIPVDKAGLEAWIRNHATDTSVKGVLKDCFGPIGEYGIFSYSNMGNNEDIMDSLRNLDHLLSGIGTNPSDASPAPAASAQQVIPAGAGATIVINVYHGAATPVRTDSPTAHSPMRAQPSTSGPTQTIDARTSKLNNDIQLIKALKEKLAAKLQHLENLHNQLQLEAKQLD